MSNIAIYARKSVFREDSISIESQIEMCRYEARGEACVIYQDNGFSGKNTDRPDFKRMMNDIKSNKVSKVIVYKLDRISRSILDFSEMMCIFQKYSVDFVSATEKFDTSSPMGRAMLNICIVFAQLERETIQQRVTDAYSARSKKGFYMGGRIPYGYSKISTTIDGVNTSMYQINHEEAEDIKLIYQLYSKPSATLGDVLREITKNGNTNKRGNHWCTARISDLMRNPAYVIADQNVYTFFKQQKANICSQPDEFNGEHSCYLFSGTNTNRKTWDLQGQNLVIAPHQGFISSSLWLTCRKKLLSNHQIKYCKPKNSWLSGKVKCGHCGYALTIKKSPTKAGRYFICTGRVNKLCDTDVPTIYADLFEEEIKIRIGDKLDNLSIKPKIGTVSETDIQIQSLRTEINFKDEKIKALVDRLIDADKTTVEYINKTINELDKEKRDLSDRITELQNKSNDPIDFKILHNVISQWDNLSFDEKRDVVELLIEKIIVYSDKIEIIWKI